MKRTKQNEQEVKIVFKQYLLYTKNQITASEFWAYISNEAERKLVLSNVNYILQSRAQYIVNEAKKDIIYTLNTVEYRQQKGESILTLSLAAQDKQLLEALNFEFFDQAFFKSVIITMAKIVEKNGGTYNEIEKIIIDKIIEQYKNKDSKLNIPEHFTEGEVIIEAAEAHKEKIAFSTTVQDTVEMIASFIPKISKKKGDAEEKKEIIEIKEVNAFQSKREELQIEQRPQLHPQQETATVSKKNETISTNTEGENGKIYKKQSNIQSATAKRPKPKAQVPLLLQQECTKSESDSQKSNIVKIEIKVHVEVTQPQKAETSSKNQLELIAQQQEEERLKRQEEINKRAQEGAQKAKIKVEKLRKIRFQWFMYGVVCGAVVVCLAFALRSLLSLSYASAYSILEPTEPKFVISQNSSAANVVDSFSPNSLVRA